MNRLTLLQEGQGFVEGPLLHGEDTLLFVSMSRGTIGALDLQSCEVTSFAETGGGPNGLASSSEGEVFVAQNGARVLEKTRSFATPPGIQQVARTGNQVRSVSTDDRFETPNDCAFAPDGSLWFTDPVRRGSPIDASSGGRVWRISPSTGELQVAIRGLSHPNGIAFSPCGTRLYVSDTADAVVLEYRLLGDRLSPVTRAIRVPSGRPDGICIDRDENIFVATTEGATIDVVRADHDGLVSKIPLPDGAFATNVCFVGDGLRSLAVTDAKGGRIWMVEGDLSGRLPTDFVAAP
jgi:gluconolactonase